MILTCIRAYSDKLPGDTVELDVEAPEKDGDGVYVTPPPWSELYLAEPDSLAAQRAAAGRKRTGEAEPAAGDTGTGGDDGPDAAKAAQITAAALAAAKDGS